MRRFSSALSRATALVVLWGSLAGCGQRPPEPTPHPPTPPLQATTDGRFTTIRLDPRVDRLALFHRDDQGRPFTRFDRLVPWVEGRGETVRFAMNAGMYHADLSPVGALVQAGEARAPLNTADGEGNFFLKPNGVFLLSDAGPRIVETAEYPSLAASARLATQSGPLLLRRGALHPALNAASSSRHIRNGVGVAGAEVLFVISERPVNLHELAVWFRDELACSDALYLDGVVSSLYAPALDRHDARADLGPMFAVVDGPRADAPIR